MHMGLDTMKKNDRRQKDENWNYVLLYLALIKRGELFFACDEAPMREWNPAGATPPRREPD
jgi:hypothetical protein